MPKDEETEEEDAEEESEDESKEKPAQESEPEETGLEEEIGDVGIQNLDFSQFIQPSLNIEGVAPVLERIADAPRAGFSLSGWEALSSPVTSEGTIEEGGPFKYSVGGGGGEEEGAKYISSEQMTSAPAQLDLGDVGRRPEVRQEVSFTQSSEVRDIPSTAQERYEPARRMDVERAGREDPFKTEKKKYDPRLPSS